MYKYKIYQGTRLSKNQSDILEFIETGSNNFCDAYYLYRGRKKRIDKPVIQIASWFNRHLKRIQKRGVLKEIPFIYSDGLGNFVWQNPGINASKANFECHTLHDSQMELKAEQNKII